MKLKNVSKKVKHFKKKDKIWVSVNPGESADLPACVLNNEKGVEQVKGDASKKKPDDKSAKAADPEEPKEPEAPKEPEEPESPEEPKEKPPKHSKSALKALSEDEQVDLLHKYGVDEETIKSLNKESKRVKHLLKLQDEQE